MDAKEIDERLREINGEITRLELERYSLVKKRLEMKFPSPDEYISYVGKYVESSDGDIVMKVVSAEIVHDRLDGWSRLTDLMKSVRLVLKGRGLCDDRWPQLTEELEIVVPGTFDEEMEFEYGNEKIQFDSSRKFKEITKERYFKKINDVCKRYMYK